MAWLFCVWDHQTLWLRFSRRSTFHLVSGVFFVVWLHRRVGQMRVVGCESVSVLLCRDERKHWACWDVLPRSHFFWGRNYLVTRSWVADPWSDRVAQRRRREGSRGRFLVSWRRLTQISNSERWCSPFKNVFQDANSFTPFIAALCVCCHKAIICLNPLYYTINLSFPQLLPLLFSKHISWQSSLLTPHEPVIS